MINTRLAYIQIIDIVHKYVYIKGYIHADNNTLHHIIESTILSHNIRRK